MDSSIQDPKLKEILGQLSGFGFSFYSFDEEGIPLIKGPNNQIVAINVAIEFVNKQIQTYKAQSDSSIESQPATENLDTNTKLETSTERAIELKESSAETQKQQQQNPNQDIVVQQKAPQIKLAQPQIKPYGDGFDPKSFNPADINQTLVFIEKNITKPNSSSQKWLAEQFKKFLAEIQEV